MQPAQVCWRVRHRPSADSCPPRFAQSHADAVCRAPVQAAAPRSDTRRMRPDPAARRRCTRAAPPRTRRPTRGTSPRPGDAGPRTGRNGRAVRDADAASPRAHSGSPSPGSGRRASPVRAGRASAPARFASRDRSMRAAASMPATSPCRRRAMRARSASSCSCRWADQRRGVLRHHLLRHFPGSSQGTTPATTPVTVQYACRRRPLFASVG